MLRKIKQFDPYIVVTLIGFMVMSLLLVYSATIDDITINISIKKSLAVIGVGLAGFIATSFFDYRILLKYWYYIYGVGIASLIGVFFFSKEIKGAKGWFEFGSIQFQPAELMKLILIIVIAALLSKRKGEQLTFVQDVLPIGLIVLVPFLMVMKFPDMGNAAIYLIILIGMYWIGNIKYTHVLIGLVIIGVVAFGGYYLYDSYHDQIVQYLSNHNFAHWVVRLDSFLYPETVNKDWSYQKVNSMTAIGSGGLTGQGYLQGDMVHDRRIPLAYTDAIFAVVGEEFGFRGSAILLLLYFVLIYRMILTAIQSTQLSGSYIIIGIVSMFVLQIFQNVGMLIGLMPITGITLPFISYGGTSLLINMVSMGLVMSVRLHQDKLSAYEQGE
ncbi:rod shape-determining protein RodA [Paenibacillus albiflavus]|uniref:Rod shape-determining protein RodA n=1 Tax=Paenibacillus albiflavus TaxID=2545760 RepID=A0A4R4E8I2_9BACL|nr:FtsW/RodA/SpoVE family cell cycle protein [Paenibacillus albiflavus]TCZ75160.1 rod shape-determining protein RodA [Paenibacillus albiflavus]